MMFPVVRELVADGAPVVRAYRVQHVSTSGYYDWRDRPQAGRTADACGSAEGVHRRRLRGCPRRSKAAVPSEDLVACWFTADTPNRLWCPDVTQRRTGHGWLDLAVVLDCFFGRVVGWAMADHLRTELVVDALQMAIWQRRPQRARSTT